MGIVNFSSLYTMIFVSTICVRVMINVSMFTFLFVTIGVGFPPKYLLRLQIWFWLVHKQVAVNVAQSGVTFSNHPFTLFAANPIYDWFVVQWNFVKILCNRAVTTDLNQQDSIRVVINQILQIGLFHDSAITLPTGVHVFYSVEHRWSTGGAQVEHRWSTNFPLLNF